MNVKAYMHGRNDRDAQTMRAKWQAGKGGGGWGVTL